MTTKVVWQDTTSYRGDERGKVEPRVWTASREGLSINLHRWHGLDGWFVTCAVLRIDRVELPNADSQELSIVQTRALDLVFVTARELLKNVRHLRYKARVARRVSPKE